MRLLVGLEGNTARGRRRPRVSGADRTRLLRPASPSAPASRTTRLGTLLFYKLCQAEKDCGARYMSLFTGINNHAQNIYKSAGFETKRYFAVMIKEL